MLHQHMCVRGVEQNPKQTAHYRNNQEKKSQGDRAYLEVWETQGMVFERMIEGKDGGNEENWNYGWHMKREFICSHE